MLRRRTAKVQRLRGDRSPGAQPGKDALHFDEAGILSRGVSASGLVEEGGEHSQRLCGIGGAKFLETDGFQFEASLLPGVHPAKDIGIGHDFIVGIGVRFPLT